MGTSLPIFLDLDAVDLKTGLLALASVVFGLVGFTLSALAAQRMQEPEGDIARRNSDLPQPLFWAEHSEQLSAASFAASSTLQLMDGSNQTAGARRRREPVGQGAGHDAENGRDCVVCDEAPGKKLWKGLMMALVGGITSSMLQFAFVYGSGMVEEAGRLGVPKPARAMVVWLLAFTIAMLPNVASSAVNITRAQAWGGFWRGSATTIAKSFGLCLVMASFFMGHIHLYGYGATVIGDLGAAVGWCAPCNPWL